MALAFCAAFSVRAQDDTPILRIETQQHAEAIRRIAVDEKRGVAVTASDDKTARVWDLAGGTQKLVLRPPIGRGDNGRLYGAAIHPRAPIVAVGGSGQIDGAHRIYLFDLDSGALLRSIDACRSQSCGDIKRLAWSADGSLLLAGFAGQANASGVRAFAEDGRLVFERLTSGGAYGISVGVSGLAAITDFDGKLHLLRAANGHVQQLASINTPLPAPVSVALSPDEKSALIGYFNARHEAQVLDLQSGEVKLRLQPSGSDEGNFMTVAWAADGRTLYVAGTASRPRPKYPVWRFDAKGRALDHVVVASNSVLDLVPLANGRVAYASFDASWGIVASDRAAARIGTSVTPLVGDLRGPSNLRVGADARRVSWTRRFGEDRVHFDVPRRVLEPGTGEAKSSALLKRGAFDAALQVGFEAGQRYRPTVNGVALSMREGELASAATYLNGTRDAVLGTTRALARIDESGKARWRVETATEVNAVVGSADGRVLVTAMVDGTLRWWRADNGTELLALFVAQDGRWLVWTPEGYFDASAGADQLAGWVVNRSAHSAAQLHSLGRFRDRYHRPDVIDRVFDTLDTKTAIETAVATMRTSLMSALDLNALQSAAAATPNKQDTPPRVSAAVPVPAPVKRVEPITTGKVTALAAPQALSLSPSPPQAREFPPALVATGPLQIEIANAAEPLQLSFEIHSPRTENKTSNKAPALEVRIDGRPVDKVKLTFPAAFDGAARASATLQLPNVPVLATETPIKVQVLARNEAGYSEPLNFDVRVRPQAVAAVAAPAPTPTVKPAEGPAATEHRPTLYVLAIGISAYQRAEYRLGLPAKDARDFAAAMSRQKGRLYGDVVVRLLTDAQATQGAITEGLDWLANTVGPRDIGMLFLAGHGVNEHSGQYYFLSVEAQHERLAETAVPERQIRDALRSIRGKTLFFVDTCFAGNVVGNQRASSRELARLANELASAENGVVVFASSSGRQLSEEKDEWGNGAFTKAVIDGLSGRADFSRSGRVTFKGLDFFVSEEVRRLTQGRQTPVTITPVGVPDFTLARL